MDIKTIEILKSHFNNKIDFYLRRDNLWQIIIPLRHEDGDMIDIFINQEDNKIKIQDCGLTLMRLSYTYEINTPAKETILNSILSNNNIENDDGNLYIYANYDNLYQNVMHFMSVIMKISSMKWFQKDVIKSLFFEEFSSYVEKNLDKYTPVSKFAPLKDDYNILEVDYKLDLMGDKDAYLFGVNSQDKAKNVVIALLEFQKAKLNFISIIVHESLESLPRKEQMYLTRNADKQFPLLKDFKETGESFLNRIMQ